MRECFLMLNLLDAIRQDMENDCEEVLMQETHFATSCVFQENVSLAHESLGVRIKRPNCSLLVYVDL